MNVRVALNALCLGPTRRGTGRYAENLIRGIVELLDAGECDDLVFDVFLPRAVFPHPVLRQTNGICYHPINVMPDGQMSDPKGHNLGPVSSAVWERVQLPKRVETLGVSVCHNLGFCSIPVPRTERAWQLVTTLHGLEPFAVPDDFDPAWVAFARQAICRAVWESDALISPSLQVRAEIVEQFSAHGDRVTCVPHGTDWLKPDASIERQRPDSPYLVWCGSIERRKNLSLVLEAIGELKQWRPQALTLNIVGSGIAVELERMKRRCVVLGIAEEVRFLGYLSDRDVKDTVAGALALLFPTKYEGFGLTALEAISCGTPVLAADIPTLHEVLADAALYVDPVGATSLAKTLALVLDESSLRDELARRGRARAEQFTIEMMARKTIAVYRKLAGLRH
jgi:glycosyltransferase involved in cell wall biosynthesis